MNKMKVSRLVKEINDIDKEKKKIMNLLSENKLQELYNYLQGELSLKYLKEKIIYNGVNTGQPINIQENANNAMLFLETLKCERESELSREEAIGRVKDKTYR